MKKNFDKVLSRKSEGHSVTVEVHDRVIVLINDEQIIGYWEIYLLLILISLLLIH